MRCTVCNTELAADAKFCSNCGNPIALDHGNQYGDFLQQNQRTEGWYGDNNRVYNSQTGFYTSNQYDMPMKWYKFLIYFSLFFSAASSLYNAIQVLSGAQYTYSGINQSELVYSFYSGLQAVDIIYGLLILALSVFCIVTRQKLKSFSKQGPQFVLWLYVGSMAIAVFYLIAATIVAEIKLYELLSTRIVISFIVSIIMVIANKVYFKKREHLFIN